MQLTRIDRWLREKYVYETHIYTLRPPESVPAGVIAEELPETPGRRFRHRFIVRDSRQVDRLIQDLRAGNQMFTTRVVDREAWYVPFIAPQGKSIVWMLVWAVITVVGLVSVGRWAYGMWLNPEMQKNLKEAFKIFQG